MTNLARLDVDRVVIGKILNHTIPGVTGEYDRHDRHDERRKALDLWAARLEKIIERPPPDDPELAKADDIVVQFAMPGVGGVNYRSI